MRRVNELALPVRPLSWWQWWHLLCIGLEPSLCSAEKTFLTKITWSSFQTPGMKNYKRRLFPSTTERIQKTSVPLGLNNKKKKTSFPLPDWKNKKDIWERVPYTKFTWHPVHKPYETGLKNSECFCWKCLYSLTPKIDFSDLYSISGDELITKEENWWTSYMELFPKFLFRYGTSLPVQTVRSSVMSVFHLIWSYTRQI